MTAERERILTFLKNCTIEIYLDLFYIDCQTFLNIYISFFLINLFELVDW